MALVPIDLKIYLSLSDDCTKLWLEDTTGQYSSTNLNGYGVPGGATSNSVDTVTVTLNYTQLSSSSIFIFTVASGVITAATLSFAGSSPISILSELDSTVWPFGPSNNLDLVKDYGVSIPNFDDMVYSVEYEVEGTYTGQDFDYTTEDDILVSCATCCCISKALITDDMSLVNPTELSMPMIASGYLMTSEAATEDGLIDKANTYLIRAKAICDGLAACSCGCN